MAADRTSPEWARLLEDYAATCAALDTARAEVLHSSSATWAAADMAEERIRERLVALRCRLYKLEDDSVEQLPIG